tara:strand:- start:5 stop:193 length:189 start_codon:yes stop_codon:yes gene_type:complete
MTIGDSSRHNRSCCDDGPTLWLRPNGDNGQQTPSEAQETARQAKHQENHASEEQQSWRKGKK